MKTLVILFLLSLCIGYVVIISIKELIEYLQSIFSDVNFGDENLTLKEHVWLGAGVLVEVISVLLYYKVFWATINDIVAIKHPVEDPLRYGIAMVMLSLIAAGGAVSSLLFLEKKDKSGIVFFVVAIAVLILYLPMKFMYVLP